MLTFATLQPPTRKSLQVAEMLLDKIRLAAIGEGEKLPSERELSEAFGVSRTVVREALNSLQLAGLVERRVGDGTYVVEGAVALASQGKPLEKDLNASISIVEAIEAREAIDLAVMNLAIKNARPQDLEVLDRIVDHMRAELDRGDTAAYMHSTLELHMAIARAGGNSVLERLVGELIGMVRPHAWIIQRNYTPQIAETSFANHKAMVEAIRIGDNDAATAAVREHYQRYPSLQKGCC
jgi:GntR family transcriptional repressor for pyruvate dehydrogenase complex